MTTMAKWEMGQNYRVDEALIREGMVMEVDDFRQATSRWPGVLPAPFTSSQSDQDLATLTHDNSPHL